jgi:hypothetical protein
MGERGEPLAGPQRALRDITASQSRADDFERGEIPTMALVAILSFGTDVGDMLQHLLRSLMPLPAPKI